MKTQNLTDSKAYTLKRDHNELILSDNNMSLLSARALKEGRLGGSGHDPRVLGSSPASGSLLRGEPAFSSLSACLSAYL